MLIFDAFGLGQLTGSQHVVMQAGTSKLAAPFSRKLAQTVVDDSHKKWGPVTPLPGLVALHAFEFLAEILQGCLGVSQLKRSGFLEALAVERV